MNDKPDRKINEQELLRLGLSEETIKEAKERERKGLLNIEPSPDLVAKTIAEYEAKYPVIFNEKKHEKSMFYRFCDYLRSWYK